MPQRAYPAALAWLGKLFQEPDIILKKHLNIINAVLQHRETVHAPTESKTAHFFCVVMHKAVHRRIDHPRPKKFDPTCAFAFSARLAPGAGSPTAAKKSLPIERNR